MNKNFLDLISGIIAQHGKFDMADIVRLTPLQCKIIKLYSDNGPTKNNLFNVKDLFLLFIAWNKAIDSKPKKRGFISTQVSLLEDIYIKLKNISSEAKDEINTVEEMLLFIKAVLDDNIDSLSDIEITVFDRNDTRKNLYKVLFIEFGDIPLANAIASCSDTRKIERVAELNMANDILRKALLSEFTLTPSSKGFTSLERVYQERLRAEVKNAFYKFYAKFPLLVEFGTCKNVAEITLKNIADNLISRSETYSKFLIKISDEELSKDNFYDLYFILSCKKESADLALDAFSRISKGKAKWLLSLERLCTFKMSKYQANFSDMADILELAKTDAQADFAYSIVRNNHLDNDCIPYELTKCMLSRAFSSRNSENYTKEELDKLKEPFFLISNRIVSSVENKDELESIYGIAEACLNIPSSPLRSKKIDAIAHVIGNTKLDLEETKKEISEIVDSDDEYTINALANLATHNDYFSAGNLTPLMEKLHKGERLSYTDVCRNIDSGYSVRIVLVPLNEATIFGELPVVDLLTKLQNAGKLSVSGKYYEVPSGEDLKNNPRVRVGYTLTGVGGREKTFKKQ